MRGTSSVMTTDKKFVKHLEGGVYILLSRAAFGGADSSTVRRPTQLFPHDSFLPWT